MADLLTAAEGLIAKATTGRPQIVELRGCLQPFEYGKTGQSSMAARFAQQVDPSVNVKDGQPYGEIWLGSTHKNGPSTVKTNSVLSNGTSLHALIASDPEYYLGQSLLADAEMQEMYSEDLPFLFKILSFDKALPLQAHPHPKLGEKLRKRERQRYFGLYGSNFVDDNGKPEVSIALSDFTAFVGFRPPQDILGFLRSVPEFQQLFSATQIADLREASESGNSADTKAAIKSMFGSCITLPETQIQKISTAVTDRLNASDARTAFGNLPEAQSLAAVWRKNIRTFGKDDVGLIVTTFLMNLVMLKEGEGCWILANDIHAYVDGDVIECMANSDNMVAHGFKVTEQGGIQTFVDMLSYRHLPVRQLRLCTIPAWDHGKNGATTLYKVPISEFDILRVNLSAAGRSEETLILPGPHTFVVTKGAVRACVDDEELLLAQGHIAFVRANAILTLQLPDAQTAAEVYGSFYQEKSWA